MFYYKNGSTYVASPTEIPTAEEITEVEYNRVKDILRNRPDAPEGYGYRLTSDLKWELYELPAEEDDPELTAEEALEIIVGGNA